jgi:ketosteroid isomerase-like protein
MTSQETRHAHDGGDARRQVALRLLKAIADKDRASASECLADQVTWWVPPSAAEHGIARPLSGRDDVLNLLCGESRYEVGTMVWEYHHILHGDDLVVVHCALHARTRAGRPYDNEYCLLYRFVGQLVVESWEHTDTAHAFAQYAS